MRNRGALWLVAAMTLIAFALRLTDITGRSLWTDESFTLLRIQGSWTDLFANVVWRQGLRTPDLHPPLYFALLKQWATGAGSSDFALRLFSAVWATLCVPLCFVLGRHAVNTRTGLLAALFVLTCPATQWYGWEVRNYGMAEAFGALLGLLLPLNPRQKHVRRAWLTWIVASIAALSVHYSFAGFVVGQLVASLWQALRARSMSAPNHVRTVRAVVLAGAAAALALAAVFALGFGWVLEAHVLSRLREPRGAFYNPLQLLFELTGALAYGMNAADPAGGALTLGIMLAACAGLCVLTARWRKALWGALAGVLALWMLLALLLENKPSFRYVIMLAPVLYVGLAALVDWAFRARMRRWPLAVAMPACAMVLGAHMHGLRETFARTPTIQDDWRAVARAIREGYAPGDVLLLNIFTPEAVLRRYLGAVPAPFVTFTELNSADAAQAQAAQATLAKNTRIWLLNTGGVETNQADIARWIPGHTLAHPQRFAARTTVLELELRERDERLLAKLPDGVVPVAAAVSGDIQLAAIAFLPGGAYSDAGNVRLLSFWRRSNGAGPSREPLRMSLRLQANGRDWFTHELDAGLESAPAEWSAQGASIVRNETLIPLPRGLPLLPYEIALRVFAGDSRQSVQEATVSAPEAMRNCCLSFNGDTARAPLFQDVLALARADVAGQALPGQPLAVSLTWWRKMSDGVQGPLVLALRPRIGAPLVHREIVVGSEQSGYPLAQWPAMHWVRETQTLDVPFDAVPGRYWLTLGSRPVGLFDGATVLGEIDLVAYPRSPLPERVPRPLDAQVGELTLLGLDQPEIVRGRTATIKTLWRVDAPPRRDGVLFLHVIRPDGAPGPQDDNPPERGARSTRSYAAGDGITQPHVITLAPDAPAGEYTVYVGIYDRDDIERWPAQQNQAPAKDNLILAGTFTLP